MIGAAATFVARPLAIALSALPFRLPWREQVFLSWAGLRGAVPIVVATIPVTRGVPGSTRVVDVVFVLVVVFTLIQAPTLPYVGRLLRVIDRSLPTDLEVEAAPLEEMGADLLQLTVREGVAAGRRVRRGAAAAARGAAHPGRAGAAGAWCRTADTYLLTGDSLLVVATSASRAAAEARLRAVARHGKLARWRAPA